MMVVYAFVRSDWIVILSGRTNVREDYCGNWRRLPRIVFDFFSTLVPIVCGFRVSEYVSWRYGIGNVTVLSLTASFSASFI